jgi:hypothetical protein
VKPVCPLSVAADSFVAFEMDTYQKHTQNNRDANCPNPPSCQIVDLGNSISPASVVGIPPVPPIISAAAVSPDAMFSCLSNSRMRFENQEQGLKSGKRVNLSVTIDQMLTVLHRLYQLPLLPFSRLAL